MPPISQTGTVEPLTVSTHSEPVVDPVARHLNTHWHTCGVWIRQVVVVRSVEVGPGGRPGAGARRSSVDPVVTLLAKILVGQGEWSSPIG